MFFGFGFLGFWFLECLGVLMVWCFGVLLFCCLGFVLVFCLNRGCSFLSESLCHSFIHRAIKGIIASLIVQPQESQCHWSCILGNHIANDCAIRGIKVSLIVQSWESQCY